MSDPFASAQGYPHLELRRASPQGPRWKATPPPRSSPEDHASFGLDLQAAINATIVRAQAQPRPSGIDPALVLRVPLTAYVDEDKWRLAGFTIVAREQDKVYILFASDIDLTTFQTQAEAYAQGRISHVRQKRPDYSYLEAIDVAGVGPLGPEDRQGRLLSALLAAGGPDPEVSYALDVELWYLGNREKTDAKLRELEQFVEARGGRVTDKDRHDGLYLARIRLPGSELGDLLAIPSIATVELPFRAAYTVAEVRATTLDDLEILEHPAADAPHLCIIDSGIARGHPLLAAAVGETIAVPSNLGDGLDVHGHGSLVAGLALYGDVEQCRQRGVFRQTIWIDAARVTDSNNELGGDQLITTQMREAITYFADQGCRIFNISLGDERLPYQGGQPSTWASTLDNLAHALDILIVVSAGNSQPPAQSYHLNPAYNDYPGFLLHPEARIIEPATAANALTVGALAIGGQSYSNQRSPEALSHPLLAMQDRPAPFTRCGFGVRGAVKPELVEHGGNYSYDPQFARLPNDPGVSLVSLNRSFETGKLFSFDRGTSFAAPKVAHAAAQLLREMPAASANLLRALLVHGSELPAEAARLPLDDESILRLYGYGQPNLARSLNSTDNRVILYAEAAIPLDWYHVYEIPIPDLFKHTPGTRQIAVTLAFDPPTRKRNNRYLGNTMSFRLLRGVDLDHLERVFKKRTQGERKDRFNTQSANCTLYPGATRRDSGTLQHGAWVAKRNRSLEHVEPFYLVVLDDNNWQNANDEPQRYALVVSLEHSVPLIPLYAAVRTRTRIAQRARIQP